MHRTFDGQCYPTSSLASSAVGLRGVRVRAAPPEPEGDELLCSLGTRWAYFATLRLMPREPALPDLRAFLARLRRDGDLAVVEAPVDPRLEAAEIHRRVIAAGGPALLFTRPRAPTSPSSPTSSAPRAAPSWPSASGR